MRPSLLNKVLWGPFSRFCIPSNLSEKKVITKTYNKLVYEEIPKNFSVTTVSNKDPYA